MGAYSITPFIARYLSLLTATMNCCLAVTAFVVNHYVTQFPGNNYFPPGTALVAAILLFSLVGVYLLFGQAHSLFKIIKELIYFFLVLAVLALATNAAQLTPFSPIDKQLIAIDAGLGIHVNKIVAWIITKPHFAALLSAVYNSLPYQMCYLPFILIFAQKFNYLREYYALTLITTLIGFVFYYFCPTLGPATAMSEGYFSAAQYATGIKFEEIHHHIPPSTSDGGMIAMPSFHAIWALLCLHLSRCWPPVFALLLPINLLLLASCVLLGWHYFVDLLGSLVVLLLAYSLTSALKRSPYWSSSLPKSSFSLS